MALESSGGHTIETRDQLVAELESGAKPRDRWLIGTEHEKFGFHRHELTPVPFEGPQGIHTLLQTMEGLLGWLPVVEEGKLIGLTDPVGKGSISLEPGGQLELSGEPVETIHQTCRELNAHLAQLKECAEPLDLAFLGLGFSPLWTLDETPVMPKERYQIMRDFMTRVSDRDGWPPPELSGSSHAAGLDMMFRTCSVQANLDFSDEADMRAKMRVAMALQPVATALFANSPFTEGKPNGFQSYRAEVWRHTDRARSGILPFVFDDDFGFESYVDWALDVPLYFVRRGADRHDAGGAPFRALLEGRLESLPGERAAITDWLNHLSSLFPEVRLKKVIEMRGADAGPWNKVCAVPALWVGLLYDADTLQAAYDLVRPWSAEEVMDAWAHVPRGGLRATIADRPILEIARDVVGLAREGLKRRARLSPRGNDETCYLDTLQEVVDSGQSPADRLLAAYHGEWQGDLSNLFQQNAY